MSWFDCWWLAIRPRTLPLSASPVILSAMLAYCQNGTFYFLPFLITLFSALCIQIGTNLFNDVFDFEKGADTKERLGPPRVVAQGYLSANSVKTMAFFVFFLALLGGIYLIFWAGWLIFLIGMASLFSGWAYTGGKYPIAYHPFGEVFVLIFFGIVAVCGGFYVQTFLFSWNVFFLSCLTGLLAASVMTINNYRDFNEDKKNNKNTLAVCLGKQKIKWIFVLEVLLPFLMLPFLQCYLPFLCLPFAIWAIQRFFTESAHALNALLAFCARLQFVFSILLGCCFLSF